MPGKTLPFRLYAQILIFSALVALGALILWPLQQAVHGGMISIRDDLISMLERQIGRKIRYSSISPSLFGSFDVRNITVMGEDETPVLTMSRFRVAYSLIDLLRGRFRSIRSVRVDTPVIDFNFARDNDLLNLFDDNGDGREGSPQGFAEMLPEKLLVRIRNGKCLIHVSGDQFGLETINLTAEIDGKKIGVEGRWVGSVLLAMPFGAPVNIRLGMRISGSCGTSLEEGEAVVRIPSVMGDIRSSSPIAFGMVMQNGTIDLQKMPDSIPLNCSLKYGVSDGSVDARLDCKNLVLRDYLSFSGSLENARQLLDIAGSGTASFTKDHDGKLGYAIAMAGTAQGNGSLPPSAEGAALAIHAAGDETGVQVDTFRLSMPRTTGTGAFFYGTVSFSGNVGFNPLAPSGVLSLNDFSLSGNESLSSEITISSYEGDINLFSETVNIGKVELVALSAIFQPAEDDLGFGFSAFRFTDVESYENVRLGTLSLEGSINSALRRLEASLHLDSFSVGDLAGMAMPFVHDLVIPAPFDGLLQGTSVTTEIFFSTDFVHLLYNAPRLVFANGTGRGFMGLVSLSGTNRRFELSEGRFILGEDAVQVSCRAEFPDEKNFDFSANINYREFGYFVEGIVRDGTSVDIHGTYGLDVRLSASGGSGYSGVMRADGFPLPFIGQTAMLSLSAWLRYDSAESWRMNLEQFEVVNIASPVGLAQLRLLGTADQNGIVFPMISYSDKLGELSGEANVSWAADYSNFGGTVFIGKGIEVYHAEGSYVNRHLDLAISGAAMRLDRVFGMLSNTLADGDIHVSWDSVDSFHAEFNLPTVKGRVLNQEFAASTRAVLDGREFSMSDLKFSVAGIAGSIPQITINGARGVAETSAEFKGVVGGKELDGSFGIAASFAPIRSWLHVGEALQSFSGAADFARLRYGSAGQSQPFTVNFSRKGGELSVSGGPRNMLRMQMDSDGNFYAGLSNPSPVRGTAVGSIRYNTINVRCGDLYVDMGGLFAVLPESPDIYLTGGYVNAAIDIRGSLTDPEFFGYARGTSLRFRIPDFMPQELRPIPFNVAIEGNEMNFGPVATATGSGAGTVSGRFLFDRWIPNIFSLDITVPRETPVPYYFNQIGFIAHGDVSGKLNISMENLVMSVSGDLYANKTELGINTDEIAQAQERDVFAEQQIPVIVDLAISTGSAVEFFYPDSRFPILRATPDMGTKVYVSVDSATGRFSLTSDVRIRSGEIFYFERNFYIRSGLLVFRENDRRFEPRLTARAEVRDRNEDGPVTISMIVDNAPLLSFTARLESSPPLSQMEILALMGQSVVGAQINEDTGVYQRAFLSSTTDLLAQFIVVRQLEQMIRNYTGLDMFSFRTQVVQNAFFMAAGIIETPIDRIGVGNYFDNTTVFGGKYIGQDMFVQGMLSMSYDPNSTSWGGMTFRPDIGIELQNPLFSIRWNFVPAHPENWYVNDNSITLTWNLLF